MLTQITKVDGIESFPLDKGNFDYRKKQSQSFKLLEEVYKPRENGDIE